MTFYCSARTIPLLELASCHSSAKFEGRSNKLGWCEVVLDGFLYLFAETLTLCLVWRKGVERRENEQGGREKCGLKVTGLLTNLIHFLFSHAIQIAENI